LSIFGGFKKKKKKNVALKNSLLLGHLGEFGEELGLQRTVV
jgi:hypothetical protein